MTLRTLTVFFWAGLIGTAAVAGEEHRTKIEIAVDGDDTGHRVFRFDSQDSDVDLNTMAVGDSQVIADDDGNQVTVRRTEDGFEFDLEGETVEVAAMHGEHDAGDVVIEKHKQVRIIKKEIDVTD